MYNVYNLTFPNRFFTGGTGHEPAGWTVIFYHYFQRQDSITFFVFLFYIFLNQIIPFHLFYHSRQIKTQHLSGIFLFSPPGFPLSPSCSHLLSHALPPGKTHQRSRRPSRHPRLGQPAVFLPGGDGGVGWSIRKNGGYFLLSRGSKIMPPLAACLTNAADASRCERSFGCVGRILVPRDS